MGYQIKGVIFRVFDCSAVVGVCVAWTGGCLVRDRREDLDVQYALWLGGLISQTTTDSCSVRKIAIVGGLCYVFAVRRILIGVRLDVGL